MQHKSIRTSYSSHREHLLSKCRPSGIWESNPGKSIIISDRPRYKSRDLASAQYRGMPNSEYEYLRSLYRTIIPPTAKPHLQQRAKSQRHRCTEKNGNTMLRSLGASYSPFAIIAFVLLILSPFPAEADRIPQPNDGLLSGYKYKQAVPVSCLNRTM